MAPLARPNDADSLAVDDNLGEYRAVSALAVAGLLTGLCSILAFAHYLLYAVPLAAVVISVLALRRIAEASPELVGRKAALTGLALGLIFLCSAPVQRALHRRDIHAQSMQIAEEWFNALRDDRPELAFRMSQFPSTADTRKQSPMKMFESGMPVDGLKRYLRESPVDLLLKLGRRARVRFYSNESIASDHEMDFVRDYFVVTVGKGSDAVSFFISLGMARTRDLGTGEWQWQITKSEFLSTPTPQLIDALGG